LLLARVTYFRSAARQSRSSRHLRLRRKEDVTTLS
jgi:hypothetical protein